MRSDQGLRAVWLPRGAQLCLLIYVLLKGSDSTVLKWLQLQGEIVSAGAGPGLGDVISVCNVFFFSSLICGLVVLGLDRAAVGRQLPRLGPADRLTLALQGSLGFLVGPTAFYFSLDRLTVISQTLLFALILPITALLARWLLAEPLPRRFLPTLALLLAGLLLANGQMMVDAGMAEEMAPPWDPQGVTWALISVLAFSASGILNRRVASKGWGPGLTVGIGSVGAAIVFAIAALVLFGPDHFIYLRLWWVLGVVGVYGCLITLGSQLALLGSYRGLSATRISLWGSLTIPIALLQAHVLLGEPIHGGTIAGMGLIVAALLVSRAAR
jgi:drug/metabolite transporter (DMT)-like permease